MIHSLKLLTMNNKSFSFLLTLLSVTVVIAIIGLLFWYFSNIAIYLIVSMVLSTILRPITNYLNSLQFYGLKMPRFLAVIWSFIGFSFIIVVFVVQFIPLISEQIQVISSINYDKLFLNMMKPLEEVENFFHENGFLTNQEEGFLVGSAKQKIVNSISGISFSDLINGLVSTTGNLFVGAMAVMFITFFFLLEKGLVRKLYINLIPNKYFEMSIAAIYKIERLLTNYLLGILLQMLTIFAISSTGLGILGVSYALTVGVFAAFANLIPYLGPFLGAIFGVLVGISTSSELIVFNDYAILVIKIASVFGVVQLVDNLVLQPVIFSKSVKVHPLEIFIAIFAGANIAGIVGMIVAIPLYTILRVFIIELHRGYKQYHIFKI